MTDRLFDFVKRKGAWAVLAALLLWDAWSTRREERAERRELLSSLVKAQEDTRAVLVEVRDATRERAAAERAHADAVAATWPRLRLPVERVP